MGVSLKVDTSGLHRLAEMINNSSKRDQIERIPQEKAIAALIGQSIADNFSQEGPGWAPLNPKTIRYSVSKKMRKSLSQMTDKEILKHEAKARKEGSKEKPFRRILRRTGLLMKTVTIPDFAGANKKTSGKNIYRVEGHNIIWGTDLVYAAIHNRGKGHIPKREFLKIRDTWMGRIYSYMAKRIVELIHGS